MLQVSVRDGESTEEAQVGVMRERRHITGLKSDDFQVTDMKEIARTVSGTAQLLTALLASYGLTALLVVPFVFMPWTIGLAFVFSAAIGIGFGYLPARNAARLDPIEALRHE